MSLYRELIEIYEKVKKIIQNGRTHTNDIFSGTRVGNRYYYILRVIPRSSSFCTRIVGGGLIRA